MAIIIPQVSEAELLEFHDSHFSVPAVDSFNYNFYQPSPERYKAVYATTNDRGDIAKEEEEDDDDDGLGHHPDGVQKRPLTGEQIAIFRHSETEGLRCTDNKHTASSLPNEATSRTHQPTSGPMHSGAADETARGQTRGGARHKKHKNKKNTRVPKPDLRKRTWDVVEPGLDSLEYD